MRFLKCALINKHGVADQGQVLIDPWQIESVKSYLHADHHLSHHEVGSIVTTKTGDKHYVSQHTDEIDHMLQVVGEHDKQFA